MSPPFTILYPPSSLSPVAPPARRSLGEGGYLNFFVLAVMAFRRVPALHALAPTESEPPFQQTQLVVLVLFVLFGIIAVRRFRLNSIAAT